MRSSQTEANAALRQPPIKVTFDTNTVSGVIDPDQQAGAAEHAACQTVNVAVKTGQTAPWRRGSGTTPAKSHLFHASPSRARSGGSPETGSAVRVLSPRFTR